jgi:hypothetical protein
MRLLRGDRGAGYSARSSGQADVRIYAGFIRCVRYVTQQRPTALVLCWTERAILDAPPYAHRSRSVRGRLVGGLFCSKRPVHDPQVRRPLRIADLDPRSYQRRRLAFKSMTEPERSCFFRSFTFGRVEFRDRSLPANIPSPEACGWRHFHALTKDFNLLRRRRNERGTALPASAPDCLAKASTICRDLRWFTLVGLSWSECACLLTSRQGKSDRIELASWSRVLARAAGIGRPAAHLLANGGGALRYRAGELPE